MMMHAVIGSCATICCTVSAILILDKLEWEILTNYTHTSTSLYVWIVSVLLGIGGLSAGTAKFGCDFKWKTKTVLLMGAIHKYFAWFVIVATQFALFTGQQVYSELISPGNESLHNTLKGLNLGGFVTAILIMEVYHQWTLKQKIPFDKPDRTMTRAEFEENVFEKKMEWIILDDLVLDVTEFKAKHPGGKFVVEHNIGRDVSKFFYGGY